MLEVFGWLVQRPKEKPLVLMVANSQTRQRNLLQIHYNSI